MYRIIKKGMLAINKLSVSTRVTGGEKKMVTGILVRKQNANFPGEGVDRIRNSRATGVFGRQ